MTSIQNFILQNTNVDGGQMLSSGYDLMIVETGLTYNTFDEETGESLFFGTDDFETLADPGRTSLVVGYVNVAVTSDGRSYWEPEGAVWNVSDDDLGPFTDDAPCWLQDNFGEMNFVGGAGTIVDFTNAAWQAVVIEQALTIVNAGLDGVFLDDIVRYFDVQEAGFLSTEEAANEMMELVNAVADAIGPDKFIVINGDGYIFNNSGNPDSDIAEAFRENVDAVLFENQFATGQDGIQVGLDAYASDTLFLMLENSTSLPDPAALNAFAAANDLVTFISPDSIYGQFVELPDPPPFTVILGTDTGEVIHGTEGDDFIFALGGNDTIYGNGGNDVIVGGFGGDMINGGDGNDLMFGGDVDFQDAFDIANMVMPGAPFDADEFWDQLNALLDAPDPVAPF